MIRPYKSGIENKVLTVEDPIEYQLPLEGVYATQTKIADTWLPSVSFLGHRVTTDGSYAVETHILDKNIGEIHGRVWLEFVGFIRENRKFDGLDALKEQILKDIKRAREILHER